PAERSSNNSNFENDDAFVVNDHDHHNNNGSFQPPLRAEAQQPEYRDAPFAIAFVLHAMVVAVLAFSWGLQALNASSSSSSSIDDDNNGEDDDTIRLSGLLWLCCLTSVVSILVSALSLKVMMHHSETLIQASLIASCVFMGISVIGFFSDGLTVMGSIQTNAGVCVLAYGIAIVANIWVVLWCLAFVGVAFRESSLVLWGRGGLHPRIARRYGRQQSWTPFLERRPTALAVSAWEGKTKEIDPL
ncbi:MAG: hypothetical protein SGILL_010466, partial [Bacillariaceae sp.]